MCPDVVVLLGFSSCMSCSQTKTVAPGEGAKARWLSSTTKRFFTIDFTSQLFFYAQSESQKTVSHPIRFKERILFYDVGLVTLVLRETRVALPTKLGSVEHPKVTMFPLQRRWFSQTFTTPGRTLLTFGDHSLHSFGDPQETAAQPDQFNQRILLAQRNGSPSRCAYHAVPCLNP